MTQRVIKFRRAYFNYDGSFYGFKAWGPNIEGGDGFISPSYIHGCKSGPDQQFSGLTDKHGKEIYERDLYRRYSYVYRVEWDKDSAGFAGIVVGRYDNNGENYSPCTSDRLFNISEDEETELVGNIYTTPELVDPKMIER